MRPSPATRLLALGGMMTLAGCGSVLHVFLDLPERAPPAPAAAQATSPGPASAAGPELRPAAIESVGNVDSVLSLLPRDHAGGIDWVAADRGGTIRPRATRPGARADSVMGFGYDFYVRDGEGPEAFFPHSTHTRWLSCESCHGSIYRYRREPLAADNPHGRQSCGRCHGAIAFRIQACERCHQQADLPPARQEPERSSTIRFERPDSVTLAARSAVAAGAKLYPPAFFPHFQHRLRYRCKACHVDPFGLEVKPTEAIQGQAHSERKCGACHNGTVAFAARIGACERCHVSSPAAVAARDSIARLVDAPVAQVTHRRGPGGPP